MSVFDMGLLERLRTSWPQLLSQKSMTLLYCFHLGYRFHRHKCGPLIRTDFEEWLAERLRLNLGTAEMWHYLWLGFRDEAEAFDHFFLELDACRNAGRTEMLEPFVHPDAPPPLSVLEMFRKVGSLPNMYFPYVSILSFRSLLEGYRLAILDSGQHALDNMRTDAFERWLGVKEGHPGPIRWEKAALWYSGFNDKAAINWSLNAYAKFENESSSAF